MIAGHSSNRAEPGIDPDRRRAHIATKSPSCWPRWRSFRYAQVKIHVEAGSPPLRQPIERRIDHLPRRSDSETPAITCYPGFQLSCPVPYDPKASSRPSRSRPRGGRDHGDIRPPTPTLISRHTTRTHVVMPISPPLMHCGDRRARDLHGIAGQPMRTWPWQQDEQAAIGAILQLFPLVIALA